MKVGWKSWSNWRLDSGQCGRRPDEQTLDETGNGSRIAFEAGKPLVNLLVKTIGPGIAAHPIAISRRRGKRSFSSSQVAQPRASERKEKKKTIYNALWTKWMVDGRCWTLDIRFQQLDVGGE